MDAILLVMSISYSNQTRLPKDTLLHYGKGSKLEKEKEKERNIHAISERRMAILVVIQRVAVKFFITIKPDDIIISEGKITYKTTYSICSTISHCPLTPRIPQTCLNIYAVFYPCGGLQIGPENSSSLFSSNSSNCNK